MRNPFRRGVDLPREVVARAGLHRGERVLAGAATTDGGWLLGTHDALLVVREDATSRIPWEQVERADWDGDSEQLVISEVGEFGHVRPEHRFSVTEPGLLLELLRERVTASVLLLRRVPVHGKKGLTVIGRRSPSGAGEVTWAYEFDRGIDPDDPDVMAAAEAALERARADVGA